VWISKNGTKKMKMYYDKKRSKRPDFKKRNKIWLIHKNFKNQWLSKKLNHVKLKLFKILTKVLNLMYKLDLLLAKIKIYLIQHVAILKPAHRNIKPLLYKMKTYKSQKENE